MRLSTEPDRDEARATAVLHAALDAGIEFLDTSDAYCLDEDERGHNERLIARALAAWPGDRSRVRVATKGGLTRPGGRWEADGRAKHLRTACERSLAALGVERLDLYQLHAPDPRTPIATSVRALAQLAREGLVGAIGLCNVTVGQIEEARKIADIESIQVELSVWYDHHFLSGVVDYCLANRLPLVAYRPLGGPQRRRKTAADPTLAAIAARHDATAAEIALAWLMDLSDLIVPIPGATRLETVASIARAGRIVLSDADRTALDERFPAAAACRPSAGKPKPPVAMREGDVVIIMGLPAAGKSTLAQSLVADGYRRLNRDEAGGTLRSLAPALGRAVEEGITRIVLDNTYGSRRTRAEVIRAASAHRLPVRCIWLSTSIEDAQTNAAWRIVSRYGRLPSDHELTDIRRSDVSAFLPGAQFSTGASSNRPTRPKASPASTSCRSNAGTTQPSSIMRSSCPATTWRFSGGSHRGSVNGATPATSCSAFRGSRESRKAHAPRPRSRRCSHASASGSASTWTSSIVPTRPVRRDAGAASRCPGSAWSSSIVTASIHHSVSTLARDLTMTASRGAWGSGSKTRI